MKIALTGGPSAGKTSVLDFIARTEAERVIVVPEAATILYGGGFPRSKNPLIQRCQQRAIYYVQRELENIAAVESQRNSHHNGEVRAILCDRGSLDGLAYSPASADEFLSSLSTTLELEMKRYDWVLHLDSAGAEAYQLTQVRIEDTSEALMLNQKIKDAWSKHPRRIIVGSSEDFLAKVQKTHDIICMILDGHNFEAVQKGASGN